MRLALGLGRFVCVKKYSMKVPIEDDTRTFQLFEDFSVKPDSSNKRLSFSPQTAANDKAACRSIPKMDEFMPTGSQFSPGLGLYHVLYSYTHPHSAVLQVFSFNMACPGKGRGGGGNNVFDG